MAWEQSGGEFVESDVIEWTEAIWPPKRGKRKQKPCGEQKIIGQVTAIEGDFIKIVVLKSVLIKNDSIKDLQPCKVGSTITRKRQTLLRGNPERLLWSEEDVREALLEHL